MTIHIPISNLDPLLNFRSTSVMFTPMQMKEKAFSDGNKETQYTSDELNFLSKPSWIEGWTRLPANGF